MASSSVSFGLMVFPFGEFSDVRLLAELAREAEDVGWDGFFLWDHVATASSPSGQRPGPEPMADPWIAMAAIAISTERIRFGPRVTPLPRRRPWKLARETVSLDHLSGGRLILGVGAGYPPLLDAEFARFGEQVDARVRAAQLDEGLDVLTGLWSGESFDYQGQYYQVRDTTFLPTPLQSPRIPIWVAATWPNVAPMRRAARWDGLCLGTSHGRPTPDVVRAVISWLQEHRSGDEPFDVSVGGSTPGDVPAAAAAIIVPFAEAGITWWTENIGPALGSVEATRLRIRQGPPRL